MPSESQTDRGTRNNLARVIINVVTGTYIVFAGVHLLRDLVLR